MEGVIMSKQIQEQYEHAVTTETVKPQLKPPPLYKVILLNDDYTPMDFVVEVLVRFFRMNLILATKIMWEVHTEGKGVCGVFTRDIAETKVSQVNTYARTHEHPLMCMMQKT